MSGIYISGMEMPTERQSFTITIKYNGLVFDTETGIQIAEVYRLPPHGDLIDLKAPFKALYYDEMTEEWLEKDVMVEDVLYGCMVDKMPPTIIPEEEGEI